MWMALFFFLTPSRTPWHRRYAEYVTNCHPHRRSVLLSLFRRDEVFSYRYDILRTRWFNIGIHNIVNSDEPMLHSHDWSYRSYMLEGGYYEHTLEGCFFRKVGTWMVRPFTFQHYIVVTKPSWTLLITGKKTNVHQFQVPGYGPIRWDLLIYKKTCDRYRTTITSDEARFLRDVKTPLPGYA